MDDVQRLKELIESGALLHPVSEALSIVDLANALHNLMGVPDVFLNDRAMGVKRLIGEPGHLVLLLADGFGMNFVETLAEGTFIRRHLVAEMRTVFPSTTPVVLTTLATGEWPGRHGVIGWFLRLRGIDAVSTIISYMRTSDKKSLSEFGVCAIRRLSCAFAHWEGKPGGAAYYAAADCRQRLIPTTGLAALHRQATMWGRRNKRLRWQLGTSGRRRGPTCTYL